MGAPDSTNTNFGMPTIEVETDHKPLEAIFKKPLYRAPARLQKMIMSIQKYSYTALVNSWLLQTPYQELTCQISLTATHHLNLM